MLIWNSVNYTRSRRSGPRPDRRRTASRPIRSGRAPSGGDFHLTAGSPAIDSANSGASGQPTADADGNPARSTTRRRRTPACGPRAYDDRGAYEFAAEPIEHIVISPASATIVAGGSQAYTAQGFDTAPATRSAT